MIHTMNPRERVLAALAHKEPDRTPRDLGGTAVSGMNVVAYRNLIYYLALDLPVEIRCQRIRHARIAEEVLELFGVDTRPVFPPGCFEVGNPDESGICTDGFGIRRELSSEAGNWDIVSAPLMEVDLTRDTIAGLAKTWPDPDAPYFTAGLCEEVKRLHKETDYAVVLSLPIGSFHQAAWLRGFSPLLMDFGMDPEMGKYLLQTLTDRWIALSQHILDACGDDIDVVVFIDDVAISTGPLMSPAMFDRILKPYEQRVFNFLHESTDARILFHSDGDITWHLEDLIEMGVDAINPVEISAGRMGDTASLKAQYGDRISFWGGIDTQKVLPFGKPYDVAREVRRRIIDLDRDGGYVLSSVHNILADVPPENICAMFEAAGLQG
jgi:uroporphyrinogen decarboxylase